MLIATIHKVYFGHITKSFCSCNKFVHINLMLKNVLRITFTQGQKKIH